MTLLGWLLAYWAFWMLIGSLIMAMRFDSFFEEFAGYRNEPMDEKFSVLWAYLKYLTLWPRMYYLRCRYEDDDDDEDDDATFPDNPAS